MGGTLAEDKKTELLVQIVFLLSHTHASDERKWNEATEGTDSGYITTTTTTTITTILPTMSMAVRYTGCHEKTGLTATVSQKGVHNFARSRPIFKTLSPQDLTVSLQRSPH